MFDDSLRTLILELKTEIGDLRNEVSTVKNSLEFFNSMYEEQKQTTKIMGEMIDEIKKENSNLRADITLLQNKISKMETEKAGKCLVINGAYDSSDQDNVVKDKTVKLLRYVNNEFSDNHIENFRIIKPRNKPTFVCVSLKQKSMAIDVLKKRKEKGNLDTIVCGIGSIKKRIYINEELDKEVHMLLKKSMQCKQKGYKYVWSSGGSIYVRKNDGDRAIKVIDSKHLKDILDAAQEDV